MRTIWYLSSHIFSSRQFSIIILYHIYNKHSSLFYERLNPQTYKIRHICLCGAEDGGFVVNIRKNAPGTTEMSGKRAKTRRFPYIKQNSIAEIVSTMESFLVAGVGFEPHDLRVMSPTSYQAALPRDMLVPETGIEPVRDVSLTGF